MDTYLNVYFRAADFNQQDEYVENQKKQGHFK